MPLDLKDYETVQWGVAALWMIVLVLAFMLLCLVSMCTDGIVVKEEAAIEAKSPDHPRR